MPSTRLMPVVMMSSRQVWSRLARDILFRPMSVQYTVSFPANRPTQLMTGGNLVMNVSATEVFTPANKAAHESTFLLRHGPFHPKVVWNYKVWWRKLPTQSNHSSLLTHRAWTGKGNCGPNFLQRSILLHAKHGVGKTVMDPFWFYSPIT